VSAVPAAAVAAQVEVWTGTRLEADGTLRVLAPPAWSAARAPLARAPRQVWPLAALRPPHLDDAGPFGRAYLSGK
jgi:hypothetical protein